MVAGILDALDASLRSATRPGGPHYVQEPHYALDASLRSAMRPGGPHYAQDRTTYRTALLIGADHV